VFVLQGLAWLSTVLIGGFNVRLGPLSIRATTPVRLLLQTIAALGLLLWISPRWRVGVRRVLASPVTIVVALFVLAAWLSLGPDPSTGSSRISGFGLYSLLYDYVPGFTGVRVPARYAMVAGVFLAIAAGFGARGLQRRWGSIALPVAALLVVADGAAMPLAMNHTWAGTEAAPPARIYPAADAPPVYRDVKALPDGSVIAEFPFGDPAWEIRAVYYAAIHGKPIVNGYSGAFPPGYRRRMAALQRFKEDGELAWQALLAAKTTHVIVRVRAFATPSEGLAVLAWLDAHGARQVSTYAEGEVLFAVPR
jgi:hypothetical protein